MSFPHKVWAYLKGGYQFSSVKENVSDNEESSYWTHHYRESELMHQEKQECLKN